MSGIWKENDGNSEAGFEMSFLSIDFVMKDISHSWIKCYHLKEFYRKKIFFLISYIETNILSS